VGIGPGEGVNSREIWGVCGGTAAFFSVCVRNGPYHASIDGTFSSSRYYLVH